MVSKTRSMIEGIVRDGSFKWLLGNKSSFDEEFEEMGRSPNSRKNWMHQLSPIANVVVRRCSRILGVPFVELHDNFNSSAPDSIKHPSRFARSFLEYSCFRALALSTLVKGHLADKSFRRLTYDMMIAWEVPTSADEALLKVDEESLVGEEAFSRVAPAIPTIADIITCGNLFNVLTTSTGCRLRFSVYDKYLDGLERAIKKLETQSESSLLSALRSPSGEKILEVDGTVTTQPVLQHVGVSTWPGRLILTDRTLYFEALRVVSFDKAKIYDLSNDLKQVVKPELTGPWGTRLFDKAVMYKSIALPEAVVMEFPELKGHSRRDYWLAIIREILYAHKFIRKYQLTEAKHDEALLKAILGILRLQAIQEISNVKPLRNEALLMFNLCDQLPGGDLILEALARKLASPDLDKMNPSTAGNSMYSISASTMMSNLGLAFGTSSTIPNEARLFVGEMVVGELTTLERVVKESRNSFKKVELAQATVDGVKVDGIDTNLAVMKELICPIVEIGKYIRFLESWNEPIKSFGFCTLSAYIICRGWVGLAFSLLLVFIAMFMLVTRLINQGRSVDEVKVVVPPSMNTVEQLLAVQTAISQFEELVQDGNVVLLKLRALLLSVFPRASDKLALALLVMALIVTLLPSKYIFLLIFLDTFTRNSPPRRASTERWSRRLKEWWFSIPAAPVLLDRSQEQKKKK